MAIAPGIFRQYDIRGIVDRDLTPEVARDIGRGFAAVLAEREITGAVAVGRDNRPSGVRLRGGLIDGLTASGLDVIDIDVVPTPLLYWTLHNLPVAAGIQITGSHNPPEYNGFKLCVGHESLHGDGIRNLRDLIGTGSTPVGRKPGAVRQESINTWSMYWRASGHSHARSKLSSTAAMARAPSWPDNSSADSGSRPRTCSA